VSKYIPGIGPVEFGSRRLAIVGEAPGYYEDQNGEPFVGPSGSVLNHFLSEAGMDRSECYITNVHKYRPDRNNLKTIPQEAINISIESLVKELQGVRPNCILALGNLAAGAVTGKISTNVKALKGISQIRGSILFSSSIGCKVVPALHPASFIHDKDSEWGETSQSHYSSRYYTQLDFKRAVEESSSPRYDQQKRNITIVRSYVTLYPLLRQFRGREYVSIDIELFGGVPCSMALSFDGFNAIVIPLRNVPAQDWIPIRDIELVTMWKCIDQFFKDEKQLKTIGQNFKFDEHKLKTCMGIYPPPLQYDLTFLAHNLHAEFPKSLAFLTSIYSRVPYYKDEGKQFNIKKDRFERFLNYNGMDACVTYEICLQLLDALKELEKEFGGRPLYYVNEYYPKLHRFYYDMENEGILEDKASTRYLRGMFETKLEIEQEKLNEICGHPVNVNSPKQINELLYVELGIPLRSGTGEDVLVALLANVVKDEKRRKVINLILECRRIRKIISSYVNAEPDYDGRLRTAYNICGAETGRSSASILEPPLRPDKIGLGFQVLIKYGEGSLVRERFIPDPGYVFMNWDLEQAEARLVALLSDDNETLTMFDTVDIHAMTAWWIFGGANYKLYCKDGEGNEPPERFIGKTSRHAGNYDMQKNTLMNTVNTNARRFGIPIQISEWRANEIIKAFHKNTPKIREVYHSEVRDYLDSQSTLVNPYGRVRQFFGEPGTPETYREGYAHIPQSTVIDHVRHAALRVKDRIPDLRFVIETHDALTALVRGNEVDAVNRIVKEEMTRPIDFSNCTLKRGSIIIPCGSEMSETNLKKFKKYRQKAA
jgi:uracil-DNA glycosylase family 4